MVQQVQKRPGTVMVETPRKRVRREGEPLRPVRFRVSLSCLMADSGCLPTDFSGNPIPAAAAAAGAGLAAVVAAGCGTSSRCVCKGRSLPLCMRASSCCCLDSATSPRSRAGGATHN